MALCRSKELKSAAGWWVLGVVFGGVSGDAAGVMAEVYPVLLAASLGGSLAALVVATFLCRGQPGIDAKEFRAQEALIGEMVDQMVELEEVVRSIRYQEKAPAPAHMPGLDRIQ